LNSSFDRSWFFWAALWTSWSDRTAPTLQSHQLLKRKLFEKDQHLSEELFKQISYYEKSCSKRSAPIKRAIWTVLLFSWAELLSCRCYTPIPRKNIRIVKIVHSNILIEIHLLLISLYNNSSPLWVTLASTLLIVRKNNNRTEKTNSRNIQTICRIGKKSAEKNLQTS
jgi:hypothetical protein